MRLRQKAGLLQFFLILKKRSQGVQTIISQEGGGGRESSSPYFHTLMLVTLILLALVGPSLAGLHGIYPLDLYPGPAHPNSSLFYNSTYSPSFCSVASDTTTPTCTFTAATPWTDAAKGREIYKQGCRSCTQSKEARCSTSALSTMFSPFSGTVFGAYCNDNYLVVWTASGRSYFGNLDNVPFPPGGTTSTGTLCRTRAASMGAASVGGMSLVLCPGEF